jgi:hypothetical protein
MVVKTHRLIGYQSHIRKALSISIIGIGYAILLASVDVQFNNVTKAILTNAYLCDNEVLENINAAVDDILAKDFDPNELEELVLELMPPGDDEMRIECGYYFVNHKSRLLLWLEDFDISDLLAEAQGANSPAHISKACSFHSLSPPIIPNLEHEIESQ